jgi:hypothetical protein
MLITYRHLCRSEATSSLIPERRLSTNRVVSEAFVQDFVLEFDANAGLFVVIRLREVFILAAPTS